MSSDVDADHVATLLRVLARSGRLDIRVSVESDPTWSMTERKVKVKTSLILDDEIIASDSDQCSIEL